MKTLVFIVAIALCSFVSLGRAEISREKRAEIEKMLRLTGTERLMNQMKTNMIAALKPGLPQLPEGFWVKFEKKMKVSDLIEKIIPVYDKYYSLEDLKIVNAFYESPAGQKFLSTLPQVMQECTKLGQEWGRKIGEQAEAEARQEQSHK
jgi:uncharacterized protein